MLKHHKTAVMILGSAEQFGVYPPHVSSACVKGFLGAAGLS